MSDVLNRNPEVAEQFEVERLKASVRAAIALLCDVAERPEDWIEADVSERIYAIAQGLEAALS